MLSLTDRLIDIQRSIDQLRRATAPRSASYPPPWTATHKHTTNGEYVRELIRADHLIEARSHVVFETLKQQRFVLPAIEFARLYVALPVVPSRNGGPGPRPVLVPTAHDGESA